MKEKIKSLIKQIRQERDSQPRGEKDICIECLDRIEKKLYKLTK